MYGVRASRHRPLSLLAALPTMAKQKDGNMKWLAVVLLVGCGYGAIPDTDVVGTNVETVVHSDGCADINRCPAFEPWRRIAWDEPSGPVYWLVSSQRGACVIDSRTFALALIFDNQPYKCETKWRRPRP